jgi:hypothetical protein
MPEFGASFATSGPSLNMPFSSRQTRCGLKLPVTWKVSQICFGFFFFAVGCAGWAGGTATGA